jgi:putative glutamate/gamma-aminobutyrate antiporter
VSLLRRPGRAAGLGVLALAMINVAAMVSPRNLPMMAEYGWSLIFFVLLAVVLFLIPVSLAIAELATAWPRKGGVYPWVREAFRGRAGFLAVWCDWAENLAWFPTVLAFTAASFAYAFDPSLANDNVFLVLVMLAVFWGATALAFGGVGRTSWVGSVGTLLGAIVPAVMIIVLGLAFVADGNASEIPFSEEALVPDLGLTNLVFLTGAILMFAGMEVAGFHADHARDPARGFPRAILLAAVIMTVFTILGSLALAVVVPQHEISLVGGVMQAFQAVFDALDVGWLLKPTAVLITIGGIAHMIPWIMGPATGLASVAQAGEAPRSWGRENRAGVPVRILVAQAIGTTLFSLLFIFVPSVSTSYWILSALTAQVIIIMYALIFAAVLRLRYTHPEVHRPYRIPGGTVGVWLAAGVGLAGAAFSFALGFVPPDQLKTGSPVLYVGGIALGLIVLALPPFLVRRRPQGPGAAPVAEAAPAVGD